MLKMVDGTGIIGVDMICPLGVSTPQPPNYDRVEMEGTGILVLPNSLDAPLERLELGGKTEQVQTTGKNLVNANVYEQGYLTSVNAGDKVSLTQMQKSFTTNMEVSSMQGKNVSVSVRTKGKTGKKYVFTDETDTIITGVFDTGSNNYSEFKNITIPQNAKKLFFSVTYDVQENTELQVELGTTVTTYEPYTGNKPSPSPEYPQEIKNSGKWNEEKQKYEVDVKITGKNLFDMNKFIDTCNFTKNEDGTFIIDKRVERYDCFIPANTILSIEVLKVGDSTGAAVLELFYEDGKNMYIGFGQVGVKTFLIQKDVVYIKVLAYRKHEYKYIQLEKGNTATPYEPYKEQTLTLTSDRPITKWDRLVEQGGEIGWLYGTKKYTVTGSENYIFGGAQYYSGISTNMYITNVSKMGLEAVCDRLTRAKGIWSEACNNKDGFTINGGNQIHMRFFNSLLGVNDDATMQEKKAAYIAYLKKEYEKGTPYEIVYQSLEPEFVPLPQSEQNAIRALKTYYPTTVITVDGGELDPDIKVTYRKEI